MKKSSKLNKTSIGVYIFAVFWSLVTIYPLYFALLSSLKNTNEIFFTMFGLPKVWRFSNYVEALVKANMARCIVNSIFLSGASITLCVFAASLAAFALTKINFKINNILTLYFTLGILIPVHSTLIPLFRLVGSIKGQNNYLVMILLYAAFQLPMAIFLIAGYFKNISKEIDEAATIDGCGTFRLYWRILMPLSVPILSTAGVMAFLFIYNELIFASLFISKKHLHTISLGLMNFVGYRSVELGPVFASIMLAVGPMIIIYLLFQEKVEKGLTAGAIKG
jgi:raffinose/stachyose/melibiose transport system permease protein